MRTKFIIFYIRFRTCMMKRLRHVTGEREGCLCLSASQYEDADVSEKRPSFAIVNPMGSSRILRAPPPRNSSLPDRQKDLPSLPSSSTSLSSTPHRPIYSYYTQHRTSGASNLYDQQSSGTGYQRRSMASGGTRRRRRPPPRAVLPPMEEESERGSWNTLNKEKNREWEEDAKSKFSISPLSTPTEREHRRRSRSRSWGKNRKRRSGPFFAQRIAKVSPPTTPTKPETAVPPIPSSRPTLQTATSGSSAAAHEIASLSRFKRSGRGNGDAPKAAPSQSTSPTLSQPSSTRSLRARRSAESVSSHTALLSQQSSAQSHRSQRSGEGLSRDVKSLLGSHQQAASTATSKVRRGPLVEREMTSLNGIVGSESRSIKQGGVQGQEPVRTSDEIDGEMEEIVRYHSSSISPSRHSPTLSVPPFETSGLPSSPPYFAASAEAPQLSIPDVKHNRGLSDQSNTSIPYPVVARARQSRNAGPTKNRKLPVPVRRLPPRPIRKLPVPPATNRTTLLEEDEVRDHPRGPRSPLARLRESRMTKASSTSTASPRWELVPLFPMPPTPPTAAQREPKRQSRLAEWQKRRESPETNADVEMRSPASSLPSVPEQVEFAPLRRRPTSEVDSALATMALMKGQANEPMPPPYESSPNTPAPTEEKRADLEILPSLSPRVQMICPFTGKSMSMPVPSAKRNSRSRQYPNVAPYTPLSSNVSLPRRLSPPPPLPQSEVLDVTSPRSHLGDDGSAQTSLHSSVQSSARSFGTRMVAPPRPSMPARAPLLPSFTPDSSTDSHGSHSMSSSQVPPASPLPLHLQLPPITPQPQLSLNLNLRALRSIPASPSTSIQPRSVTAPSLTAAARSPTGTVASSTSGLAPGLSPSVMTSPVDSLTSTASEARRQRTASAQGIVPGRYYPVRTTEAPVNATAAPPPISATRSRAGFNASGLGTRLTSASGMGVMRPVRPA